MLRSICVHSLAFTRAHFTLGTMAGASRERQSSESPATPSSDPQCYRSSVTGCYAVARERGRPCYNNGRAGMLARKACNASMTVYYNVQKNCVWTGEFVCMQVYTAYPIISSLVKHIYHNSKIKIKVQNQINHNNNDDDKIQHTDNNKASTETQNQKVISRDMTEKKNHSS